MPDISNQYERQLEKLIRLYSKRIQAIYHDAINQVSLFSALSGQLPIELNKSIIDLYPALKIKLDQLMSQMHDGIYKTVASSIDTAWQLSNKKNDDIADSLLADMPIVPEVADMVYNPNADALTAFIARKEKGMNLSDRVWNLVEPYKYELEAGLADGIGKGRSAASMATDMKRYLKEPDKLFRRVRDDNGKMQLSKAARDYSPGQGTYRSSYQNALRLTGTETNIAYRSSDHERWKDQVFTKGIEVRTSPNNHPLFDICDEMKGQYPKDFKFTGWHPRCRCFSVPIIVSDEEFDKQQDYLLGLTDKEPPIDEIKGIPENAQKFIQENEERIAGWKSKPYWVKDNNEFYNKALKGEAVAREAEPVKASFVPAKTIKEAEERIKASGVEYVNLKGFGLDHANASIRALETIPTNAIPDALGNGAAFAEFTNRPIGRKANEWYGVSITYPDLYIQGRSGFSRGIQKDVFKDYRIVGINTREYSIQELTDKKVKYNEWYKSKYGNEHFFNTDGELTHFHEYGHIYDGRIYNQTIKKEFEGLAGKWEKETKYNVLKSTSEAFAEAFADYFGNEAKRLPDYIKDFFDKNIK